jgi:ABC-type sugar transport system substrate-binding protein
MSRRVKLCRWLLMALASLVVALSVAACGDDDSSDGGGSDQADSAPSDDPASKVTDEQLQETINKAMGAEVDPSTLPEPLAEAFRRMAVPLSQEQLDLAFECWEASQCDVGDGEVVLAIVDGNDNTWRKFTKMETILQALTYPEIGRIIYTQANGDLAKMQSNIRNVTAQGAKAIVTYDDFGAAVAPAFAAAQRQGAVVSNYLGPVDAGPEALKIQAIADNCQIGKDMADATAEAIGGKGTVAYFNGTPGNPQGETWNRCATEQFEAEHPDIKPVAALDTNWSPAGAAKAASSLISGGKDVDAILYDFADPLVDVVKTYEKAGKPIPDLITWTENNGLYGVWKDAQGTDQEFTLVTTSALGYTGRLSVTAVMESIAGEEVPNELIFPVPFFEAQEDFYRADLPADFPGTTSLIPESLIDRMLQ